MTSGTMRLAFEEWPKRDAELWRRGTERRRVSYGVAAGWRPRTILTIMEEGYGPALGWLKYRGLLDPELAPDQRWPAERVYAYADDLSSALRPATVKNRILFLERALAVLAPASDRSAFRAVVQTLSVLPDGGRKRNRLQHPERLVTLGLELMNRAEQGYRTSRRKNAALFRDGLQIALLALRGLRKGNFVSIGIGTNLVRRAGEWWLVFAGEATKNGLPIEVPFPGVLLPQLQRYLERYRPLLAGDRYTGDRLWVTYLYGPQAAHSLQLRIVQHTEAAFGQPINPHLFRDCIATSIAIHDPENVRMAATILGHTSFATTERHYNLARTLEAGRSYGKAVLSRRRANSPDGRARS